MTKMPTTEKPSRKDALVSGLLLSLKSLDRAVVTHWPLLLMGIPVMTTITMSLGYLSAPEPCRESFTCVQLHVVESIKPFFGSIEGIQNIPDEGKLPVLLSIACMCLYAFAAVLYASNDLVTTLRMKGSQGNAG